MKNIKINIKKFLPLLYRPLHLLQINRKEGHKDTDTNVLLEILILEKSP